ncbi:glutathione S-transferase kappa 1 [Lepidopterella palustris CBS 459.81]|uniref:Glutathione S-transferase kappa n=1 Tax=Lepidopterella palustris CBS 459.81 TaxID=1314670 RepID=A0A8E2EBT2_9PEZI|nr:glutathione S-transferase kappa 1 [Lepidopterella palustris CBS 459.81]
MGGKIACYLDCVSPYSYFAFLHLQKNSAALLSHDVEVEFIPVFLGGINVGSGNKPPWTLPAKAKYSHYDFGRAKKYFDTPNIKTPSFFPILSLLPQRSMTYIKSHFPKTQYESAFGSLWVAMWQDQLDISKPNLLARILSLNFSAGQVKAILEGANKPEYKQKLLDNTQEALSKGAFGCPWFWVTNGEGKEEPFFGSDRFHFMWEFLGLPWKDVELLLKDKAKI